MDSVISMPETLATLTDSYQDLGRCLKISDAHPRGNRRVVRRGEQVVLNVQDTSTLNFKTHSKLKGQGPIGSSKKATGFHLHTTALIGADSGIFHGVLGAKIYARDGQKRSKQTKETRNRERIEEKESYRWIESMKMSVACGASLQAIAREEGNTAGAAPQQRHPGEGGGL